MWVWLLTFTLLPQTLSFIWWIFGIQRWADVLVYASIIFLIYFSLLLLRKVESNKEDITRLVREIAINNSWKNIIEGKEVFVIPAYNEAEVIWETINTILDKWYKNIIVINDWSRDNSLDILSSFWSKIILLNHYKNRGQWAALETWFEYLRRFWRTDYIVSFDADGQHDINDLNNFYKYMDTDESIDIWLGSRFLSNKKLNIPLSRRIILKLWIFFTFFLSQIKLSDTHNGYRVIRSRVISKLKITIDGMWHASELLDLVAANKLKYKEVAVHIRYTDYSLKKGQSSRNAISIALGMIWNKLFK